MSPREDQRNTSGYLFRERRIDLSPVYVFEGSRFNHVGIMFEA